MLTSEEIQEYRRRCDLHASLPASEWGVLLEEVDTLQIRCDYLLREINLMRRAMQAASTWDQFCADYAAFKEGRKVLSPAAEEKTT